MGVGEGEQALVLKKADDEEKDSLAGLQKE